MGSQVSSYDYAVAQISRARRDRQNRLKWQVHSEQVYNQLAHLEGKKYYEYLTNDRPLSHLRKIPIEICDLDFLIELKLIDLPLENINALSCLTRLNILTIKSNCLENLQPISSLKQLVQLSLQGDMITDLSPLRGLTHLRQLSLSGANITDIHFLKEIHNIEDVSISYTSISDFSALKGKLFIKTLLIQGTPIADLSFLSTLKSLETIIIANCSTIIDIAPLSDLPNLKELTIVECPVVDVSPLSNVVALRRLIISQTNVVDLRPLARLQALADGDGLRFAGTPAAEKDEAHRYLAAIGEMRRCARELLQYLNGEHPTFGGPPDFTGSA